MTLEKKAQSLFLVVMLFGVISSLNAQKSPEVDAEVKEYLEKASHYSELALYPDAAAEYEKALKAARKTSDPTRSISINIAYAELLRKSREVDKALAIIESLEIPSSELLLRVKMLDRKAAIISEMDLDGDIPDLDSVRLILDRAIILAEKGGFVEQLASLKNHRGNLLSRDGNPLEGQRMLLEAAHLFMSLRDTQNYVVTKIHVAQNLIEAARFKNAFDLLDSLKLFIQGSNNHRLEIDLFNQLAYCYNQSGDTFNQVIWEHEAAKSYVKYNNAVHNHEMAAFKAQYENEKFQEIAEQKSSALEEEKELKSKLILILGFSVLLMLLVAFLLFREIGLKQKIKKINVELQNANDRYQMLIVESNHRIKNNLQMVISMINFSGRNQEEPIKRAFKRVNKSIFTIAALHKHLYPDVHKEKIDLKVYCDEIIDTYRDVTSDGFELDYSIISMDMKGERVVYFGLILNELLSNTIEHGQKAGLKVHVSIEKREDLYHFIYQDGSTWQVNTKKGLGIGLIELLVKSAKGFDYQLDSSKGCYSFSFKP